ncbi:MAG TPA: hypothetical protein VK738_04440 [Terriglobales bacterium]|jgi:hypothetical protein|nr:hypothetical protein [Terriglobales bacterium]
MPDGQEEQLDFSDIGGQRVAPPPVQEFDFSDLGGQRVGRVDAQQPSGGFFSGFGDLGPLSVQNHPGWLKEWPTTTATATSRQPQSAGVSASENQQTTPLDFSDIGGQRVGEAGGQLPSGGFFSDFGDMGARALQDPPDWLKQWPAPETRLFDFSDIGGQRVTGPSGHTSITPTQLQRQATPATSNDFSDIGGVRVNPPQPQKSTWEQLLDLNDAIDNAEMRTAAGAGKDIWEAAKGVGSLVKPPDFMLHPIDQRPKTLGEAISQGLQAGAYTTGLTTVGRAAKGYYDATRANIDRAEQAGQQGDYTGVAINSAAAGLPLVGPLIGGLYEDAQTNDLPTMAGKGISRIGQAMSMAPERSFIPNPVSLVTKGAGSALSKVGDGADVYHVAPRVTTTTSDVPSVSKISEGTSPKPEIASEQRPTMLQEKEAPSTNYRETFFKAHPELRGKVWVHHAIEQQVLRKFPGLFTEEEIHALENLRGIPKELNPDLHLSQIRQKLNEFYELNPNPTREQFLQKVAEIDAQFRSKFKPPK